MIKYIEQLLQGQLVEWKSLGEVAEIQKGKQLNKTELTEVGRYPAYNGGVSYSGFTETYNYPANTIIVSQGGASAGYVNFVETEFYANAHCYVVLPNEEVLTRRFAYHYLKMKQGELMGRQIGAGIPGLSTKVLLALPIPLPPLSVQAEIVRILDSFTSLTAELEAELEARRAQCAHYRAHLFPLLEGRNTALVRGGGVWRSLGEVCRNVCSGGTPSRGTPQYYTGSIPWVRTQEVDWKDIYDTAIKITEEAVKDSSAKLIPANCVIIAMYGATAAKACINKIPVTTNQACCNLEVDERIANYRYVYYWICKEYEALKSLGEGSQANLSLKKIKTYPIPIPPLEEQERIVRLLDEFDTLTSSLTEGLPREIELRRQQYAYYRDQLLSFPREADAS